MLLRAGHTIIFECDDCGDDIDTDTDDFREARDCLKDNDWKARKYDDVWCHYCPACADSLL